MSDANGAYEPTAVRRILGDDHRDRSRLKALILSRKRRTTVSILAEFERTIEPLIPSGHHETIQNFKRVCRRKIGGLTHEAVRLLDSTPGDDFNELAIDMAEATEDDSTED